MRNKQYWIDRANRRMDNYTLSAFDTARVINRSYNSLKTYIDAEIAKILRHVGGEDTLAYEYRMKRLAALLGNTERKFKELYGINLATTTAFLKEIIPEAYYHTIFDIAQGIGEQPEFSAVNTRLINKILNEDWSGENYSKRIWSNTNALAEEVREVLTEAAVSGESIYKTSRKLSDKFNQSAYNSQRLIRTETTYATNQAELLSYEELDIDKYEFVATLDTRTSSICQKMDGKVFKTSDAQAGKNLPAMHPNCRSTTIPYFAEGRPQFRTARDKDGKRIKVPADMKYDEWYKKYIEPYEGEKGTKKRTKPSKGKDTTPSRTTPQQPQEVPTIDVPAPSVGVPEYKDEPIQSQAEKIVSEWESENYKSKTEKGLLIQPDGTIKDFGGIEHHVTGQEDDIKLMNGAIFTHNHPTDNTFSQNDIVTGLLKGNLKELRAVTSTGDLHILKNIGATEQQLRKFNVDYQQRRMKAANAADAKIRRGENINKEVYVKSRLEDFMSEHGEEYNLKYIKSKLKEK